MILTDTLSKVNRNCITRTCGGDPIENSSVSNSGTYYPHMRGWSSTTLSFFLCNYVLPAHAGVIPVTARQKSVIISITRTCGGDPDIPEQVVAERLVLPAHAGVILNGRNNSSIVTGITRTCGGDPHSPLGSLYIHPYYPHMRGWSLRHDLMS